MNDNLVNKIVSIVIAAIFGISFNVVVLRYGIGGLLGARSDAALIMVLIVFVLLILADVAIVKLIMKWIKQYDTKKPDQ